LSLGRLCEWLHWIVLRGGESRGVLRGGEFRGVLRGVFGLVSEVDGLIRIGSRGGTTLWMGWTCCRTGLQGIEIGGISGSDASMGICSWDIKDKNIEVVIGSNRSL
jgi:hypothetical protein